MNQKLKLENLHPLKSYTTLNIGGCARYFGIVNTLEEYLQVLDFSKKTKLPIFVLGKGSNTLFVDEVFEAIVVLNRITHITWELPCITCGSGYHISLLSSKASRKGYSGLEGASGIPATVGGAIFMNAGSGEFETKNALLWVKSVNQNGNVVLRQKDEIDFSYRHSSFQELDEFIYEAAFCLKASEKAWDTQQAIIKKRIASQPYKNHSAGCFFKNPQGTSAGALIDMCGLKGLNINGASVSNLHANFLVNLQEASSQDLLELAKQVKEKVFEKTGIHLEQEVRLVGNFLYEKV